MDYTKETDSMLDYLYDSYMSTKQYASAFEVNSEIVQRVSSVSSFVGGLFGASRFPKWEVWQSRAGGFNQSEAARSAVAAQAAVVAKSAADVAGKVGSYAVTLGIIGIVLVLLVKK